MYSDILDLVYTPNDWYSSTIEYIGEAYAEFGNPKGWIRGQATCKYDEIGVCTIELEIKDWHNDAAPSDIDRFVNYAWLAAGYRGDSVLSAALVWGSDTSKNICDYLEIKTAEGVFKSNKPTYSWNPHSPSIFKFVPERANFQVFDREKNDAEYWAIPLLNFLSHFPHRYQGFENHPLRIFPVRNEVLEFLHSDAPDNEKHSIEHNLAAQNYLIGFTYHGEPGFIERLPNYYTYERELRARTLPTAQTCMMIGSAKNLSDELDPIDILPILSVAVGNDIGAQWIEFRDKNANLISRHHANFGASVYRQARIALPPELIDDLITTGIQSQHFGKPEIRAIMRNYVSSNEATDVSTMFFYLCAALDVMCRYCGVTAILTNYLTNDELQNDVILILERAVAQISKLAKNQVEPNLKTALDKIANNVRSQPLQKRPYFGDKIVALLSYSEFNFQDKVVTDRYFESIGLDTEVWTNTLSYYRNQTMHHAYYPSERHAISEEAAWLEMRRTLLHLRDILLRCILRLLNCQGEYYPAMLNLSPKPIDWITDDTPPKLLGYD